MDTVYLTREGLEKARRELERLIKETRPEATAQLAAARSHGDLSENAEYDAAKEKLADIDRRIAELQQKLTRVRIIEQDEITSEEVRILSRVTLFNLGTGRQMEYTLVDPMQANPALKLISIKSPIGQGLLGKKVGEEVEVSVPSGKLSFRVEAIARSEGL